MAGLPAVSRRAEAELRRRVRLLRRVDPRFRGCRHSMDITQADWEVSSGAQSERRPQSLAKLTTPRLKSSEYFRATDNTRD